MFPIGTWAKGRVRSLHRWWLDRSVRAKGLTVVTIPLIALISIGAANVALQHSERHERAIETAATNVSAAGAAVLADAVDAETGIRGYAATQDVIFLDPYTVTLTRIAAERRGLGIAALAAGAGRQQALVDATTAELLVELAQLRSTISAGAAPADTRLPLQQQKATVDALRSEVAALIAGPAATSVSERSKLTHLESQIDLLNIIGILAGILAGLAGVALFTSGISRRVVTAATNADRLGLGQPLEHVAASADELGRLAGSLVRAEELLASRSADLISARDEALQATQAKTAFLSHTSHELRTPLNSILGFTQLLEISDLSAEDHDSVERILGAGRHLLRLINELIDVARIESGDLNISVESVAVVPLIAETSQLFGPLAAERAIAISHHCTAPHLAVYADHQRLSQVLVNLLSNAVKYNRQAGTITITCEPTGADQVSVAVVDSGPGLTHEDLERIFVPFERLAAARSGTEGTGLGLPLAKALTEAMAGNLIGSSVVGTGSTFTVTLPRAPDLPMVGPADPAPAPVRGDADPTSAITILYIEDNPANVEVVSRFVRGLPYASLEAAKTGRAGIESALRAAPDLILLDLDLGDLHGSEVLHQLKTDSRTMAIPVVILSADASPGVIRRLLKHGALGYLTKPIDLAQLGELFTTFPR